MNVPDGLMDPESLVKEIENEMCASEPKLCVLCASSYFLEDIRDVLKWLIKRVKELEENNASNV